MKFRFLACAAISFAIATPAFAQDEDTSGGKIVAGALVGVDSVNAELEGITDSEEDILFGVTVGYDYETQSGIVFGIEGEYSDSSVGVSVSDAFLVGDRVSVNAGRDFYVGGRLGFRAGNLGLLYVKGGYTDASIELEYDDGTGEIADELSFGGFRVGAGGEFDFSSNAAIRIEYRYSDYGSIEALGFDSGVDASRNQGVITFIGKF